MKQNYSELLKDPRWQKKRLEIFNRDNFTCQHCGRTDRSLQVHHLHYEKDKNPWDYDNDSLITLCERCHQNETDLYKNEIYERFKSLKEAWMKANLSLDALYTLLTDIYLYVSKYEGDEELFKEEHWRAPISIDIFNSICGTQHFSDYLAAYKLGIDCTKIIKNTDPRLLDEYNKRKGE